jgi:hypothetical protein
MVARNCDLAIGGFRLLACGDQLLFDAFAFGDVPQNARKQHFVADADFADVDLDRKLAAILTDRGQFAANDADDLAHSGRQELLDAAMVRQVVCLRH